MRKAILNRGVSVVVLPGDVALQPAPDAARAEWYPPQLPVVLPSADELATLTQTLNDARNITLMCGSGCAGAHEEVVQLAATLKAPVVHALRGKEHIEYDNPYDVGMTGLIGFSSGYHAMMNADTLVLLGTQFPIAPSTLRKPTSFKSILIPAVWDRTVMSTRRTSVMSKRRCARYCRSCR